MPNIWGKKGRAAQYAIGGAVAFIILLLWISVPLMDRSAWNTSVPESNPFSSKSVNLRGLSDGMGYESGAPGSPLSGELTYNPATSGEDIHSSLYNSGFDELASDSESGDAGAVASKGSSSKYSPSANTPSSNVTRGKLSKVPSFGSGGSNTGTTGNRHSKFFGDGNDRAKFDTTSPNAPIGKVKKDSKLLASVNNSQKKSKEALDFKGKDEMGRSGIAAAFNKLVDADNSEILTNLEDSAAESGIVEGEIGDGLKKSDPNLNKSDISLPEPEEADEADDNDEQYKQMLIKMMLNATVGSVFGAIGDVMKSAMLPEGVTKKPVSDTAVIKPKK
ncbi:MAG: hypothetical protein L6420_11515 [Elusimicrobia bacterium]|nr:hypothetical protein [Elusimicrobiota bacterium]